MYVRGNRNFSSLLLIVLCLYLMLVAPEDGKMFARKLLLLTLRV